MKLTLVSRKDVSYVKLVQDEGYPLGITLKDGIKDEEGPVVRSIKPKSVAARSHALAEGDTFLSVNGRETAGSSSRDIQGMLTVAGLIVDLKILYPVREACISRSGVYRKKRTSAKLQKAAGSFGFVLRRPNDSTHPFAVEYPVVSAVKFGGPAQRDGRMQEGDRLLKVDDISVSWLPLPQIAAMMEERSEALFTFEYRIRVLDFPKSKENKIDLEIDVPHIDLGIGLFAHAREPHGMYIGTIRLSSVAERCGAFSEGDIILSINDIDVQFLTVSKANCLLRSNKPTRRISYIPAKIEEPCQQFINCTVAGIPKENYTKTSASSISIRCEESDKHFNTPASSNTTTLVRNSDESTNLCQKKQVTAIKRFRDIVKHMTGLKLNLSRLTLTAFNKNSTNKTKFCSVCNRTQHSVKLCASCLAEMNAGCAQSMEYLRSVIKQFIDLSTEPNDLPSGNNNIETSVTESHMKSVAFRALTETLPKAFVHTPTLLESFKNLADKMSKVNAKCDKCKSQINSVSVTVQKLLLLLSLDDGNTETATLIDQMARCLMSTKFTCEEDLGPNTTSLGNTNEAFEPDDDECSATASFANDVDVTTFPQNIVETEPDREKKTEERSTTDVKVEHLSVDLNKQSAYFKITSTPSLSDTESLHSGIEFGSESDPCQENVFLSVDSSDDNLECSENSKTFKDVMEESSKTFYKDKGLKYMPAKVWKSLDSFLNPRISRAPLLREGVDLTQNGDRGSENANNSESRDSNLHPPTEGSASNQLSLKSDGHAPNSNDDSPHSPSQQAGQSKNRTKIDKTHCETMDVKLKNDGDGFGIVLGFNSPRLDTNPRVPILTAIKPHSPAKKIGVLDKKDRVIAVNRENVVGLPLSNLEKLKKTISVAQDIILTIEFDVDEPELEFGTFDVILQRNLKPGLIFENLKEGSPLVVSGVVKGAAAHRSGRLFPGDKLLAVRCVRNEEFYPVFRNYTRNDFVRFTVFRKSNQASQESSVDVSPTDSNPFLFTTDSRTGDSFIIKHTYVHPMENTDSLVLDQDITLFRDPTSWDFGFLVGENPNTGQAYITDVRPGGPAHACGVIKRHDRIVKVDGVMVGKDEERSVLSLIPKANERVDLLIRRIYHERTDGRASPT